MTTLALIIQPLAFAVILGLVLRHLAAGDDAREEVTTRVLADLEQERVQHRAEIQSLLQRIQAPTAAVIQHAQSGPDIPGVLPLTDEEAAVEQQVGLQAELALAAIAHMEREEGVL